MYCKYCGNRIADDNIFCSKCGSSVTEARPGTQSEYWMSTKNLQWKKPIVARRIQIAILIIVSLLSIFPLWKIIESEIRISEEKEVLRHLDEERRKRLEATIQNINSLFKGEKTTYTKALIRKSDERLIAEFSKDGKKGNRAAVEKLCFHDKPYGVPRITEGPKIVSYSARNARDRMVKVLLLFAVINCLTIFWIKCTRFPNVKDIIPRDIADEIEPYEWLGFTRSKYVLYKKNGKYGIIDACNYRVNVPAKYDYIAWRIPGKSYEVTIDGKRQIKKVIRA